MFRRLPLSRGCFRMLSGFSLLLGAAGASLAQYWPGYPPVYQPPYPYRPPHPGYQVVGPIPVNGQQPIILTTARPPCVWPGVPQPLGMPMPAPQGYAPYPGMAPSPMPSTLPTPATPSTPSTTPSTPSTPSTTPATPSTPSTDQGQGTSAAPSTDNTASGQNEPGPQTGEQSGTPYIFGNLLQSKRSVSFLVNRTQGNARLDGTGATTIVNPKVAENNSAIPRDRVGIRYNYFNNALQVTGIAATPIPASPPTRLSIQEVPETRKYDAHTYTLDLEKTFLDGLMSVQVRVPYTHTLSSRLNLVYGTVDGLTRGLDDNGNPVNTGGDGLPLPPGEPGGTPLFVPNVTRTPELTLGESTGQFGDMSLIFKGIMISDSWYTVSGGVSVLLPTAPDTRVRVTDYSGYGGFLNSDVQRIREIHVSNATWSLSPFAAFVATPCERLFVQGFAQVEIPLNTSEVQFQQTSGVVTPGLTLNETTADLPPGGKFPPFVQRAQIREQALMHLDLNCGYWALRRPNAAWITGLAPILELHYTTTLNNAQLVNLQTDFLATSDRQAPPPELVGQVGNRRNRLELLDMTIGSTVELGRRALVGTAFSLPLLQGDNRTFDWEFQFQLNYLFGSAAGRPSAPYIQ